MNEPILETRNMGLQHISKSAKMMDGGTCDFGGIMMGGINGIFANVGGTRADGGS